MEFKVGDKVRYVGTLSPELRGDTGTITEFCGSDSRRIKWDNHPNSYFKILLESLEKLTSSGKPEYYYWQSPYYPLPGDYGQYVGVDWGIQDKPKKTTMSIIKNIFKSEQAKALSQYGITNGEGGLTNRGQEEFVDYLWEIMATERKAFIAKIVEEYKKEKGENK